MVHNTPYFGNHAPAPVPNPEELGVEHDLVPMLFELSETHYVGSEPRDQVDSWQHLMFTGFATDQYGASPFNVHHHAVTKPDRAMHLVVNLRECTLLASHMIRGA
jgi:hypothetical protein